MNTEVKSFNNEIIQPGNIVPEVKKVDDDTVMGLDYDEDRLIKVTTKDGNIYNIKYNYLLISDYCSATFQFIESSSKLNLVEEIALEVDSATMDYIIQYLDIRKGQEIRIGYSHLAKMNKEQKEVEMNRLRDAKISYKCKSALMIENLPDNPEEVKFIDQFSEENGGPALRSLLEAANYLGIHSLLALCAIKIRSFTIGVHTKDLAAKIQKIFRTGDMFQK